MKIFKLYIILVVTVMSALVHAAVADKIVALVNDEIITMSDLNNAFEGTRQNIEESYKNQDKETFIANARMFVLNRLIDKSLAEQYAKKTGIEIRDEEVMEAIKNFLERGKITMTDLLNGLAKDKSSIEEYKQIIKNQILTMKIVRREIRTKITVSEDEIGAYYTKHRDDYEGKEAVRIMQVFIPLPQNPAVRADKKAEMEMVRKQIKEGEPLEKLAMMYAKGPAAGANGDIGFVERGMMVPDVEKAAFSLRTNEISDVIESSIGFHIIKVIDRRGAGIQSIESVRLEILERLEAEKTEKKYAEWLADLRSKSHIKINL